VLCIDDFLPEPDAAAILRECFELRKIFMPARVFAGPTSTTIAPKIRSNEVVYLNDVFRDAPHKSCALTLLGDKIWTDECRELWHEGDYIFDIINYATHHEAVMSRYGADHFYEAHQDTRRDRITTRIVSLVYYVNLEPARFGGGELILIKDDERLTIEPRHNRAVVFPSFLFHAVQPVTTAGDDWEDGRFSVNYWLGFR
jgi:hypothetical protein